MNVNWLKNKWLIVALVLAVLAIFVVVYFEPQALFIDKKSNEKRVGKVISNEEAEKTSDKSTQSTLVTTTVPLISTWRSREHHTTGNVLLTQDGNTKYVRFEDLDTDNGPDLKVYIAKNLESDGTPIDFVNLGDLKANKGDANYAVPSEVDISQYNYVVIWCKRFSVSFADSEI